MTIDKIANVIVTINQKEVEGTVVKILDAKTCIVNLPNGGVDSEDEPATTYVTVPFRELKLAGR